MLGIDIGGTKIAIAVGTAPDTTTRPTILERIVFPTEAELGFERVFSSIVEEARKLLNTAASREAVERIGIACGGPLDVERGRILSPPNLPGWDDIPITELISDALGAPARLLNDADAGAVAEWKYGAGRGCRNLVFLTFGTGMGAGLILNGRLYRGTNGLAGEIGHVRITDWGPVGHGKAGSFEGYCSGGGIAQVAQARALENLQTGDETGFCSSVRELNTITTKKVAEAAFEGDQTAMDVFHICGENLGRGLAILVDLLNPEIIILGNVYRKTEELLRPPTLEVLERESIAISRRSCRIVPTALEDDLGLYAAFSAATLDLSAG